MAPEASSGGRCARPGLGHGRGGRAERPTLQRAGLHLCHAPAPSARRTARGSWAPVLGASSEQSVEDPPAPAPRSGVSCSPPATPHDPHWLWGPPASRGPCHDATRARTPALGRVERVGGCGLTLDLLRLRHPPSHRATLVLLGGTPREGARPQGRGRGPEGPRPPCPVQVIVRQGRVAPSPLPFPPPATRAEGAAADP